MIYNKKQYLKKLFIKKTFNLYLSFYIMLLNKNHILI